MPQTSMQHYLNLIWTGWIVVYAVFPPAIVHYKPWYEQAPHTRFTMSFAPTNPNQNLDICNQPLLCQSNDEGALVRKPINHLCTMTSMTTWLVFFSHADLEEAWISRVTTWCGSQWPYTDYVEDVWGCMEFLRTFEEPSPGTIFIDRQGEGCL